MMANLKLNELNQIRSRINPFQPSTSYKNQLFMQIK